MFLSTLRGMRQRWQPCRTSSTQCWESRQPSAEKRLGGKSGSSSFVPCGASGRPGARTDDAGQLGTRSEPGIKAIVLDPGDVDRRSGAPYRASGARLQQGRGFAALSPLTQLRMLAKLFEVLQVDLGIDERAYTDQVVQWEQRIHEFETMSRETLPDVIKRAIITERSPPEIRTHWAFTNNSPFDARRTGL